jgi:hypothetical protein
MVTFLRDNLEACIAAVAVIVSLFAWCRAGRANKIAQEVLDWQREGISSPSSAQEALRDMARRGEEMAGEPLDGAAVLDWSRDAAAQLKSMLADEGAMYEFQSQCGLRGNATRPAAERFGNGVAWLRAKADSLTFNDLKATYRNRK